MRRGEFQQSLGLLSTHCNCHFRLAVVRVVACEECETFVDRKRLIMTPKQFAGDVGVACHWSTEESLGTYTIY